MKKKIALSVLALVVILSSFGLGAYAAVRYSLIINGKTVKADIKVINGTPYIPLPALSSNLKGITVKHDAKKGTIKIDEPKPSSDPATKPAAIGLSRSNPAPIGTIVTFNNKNYSDDYQATFNVEQVIRGAEALKMMREARYNSDDNPPVGYEYMLVKLTVAVTKNAKPDAKIDVNFLSFKLISSSGKEYDSEALSLPEIQLEASLYAGASDTGWGIYKVKPDDTNPLLTFGRNYDGTGGVWLKTS